MLTSLGVTHLTTLDCLCKQSTPHWFRESTHQTERTLQAGWGVESFNQQIFTGTELVNEK